MDVLTAQEDILRHVSFGYLHGDQAVVDSLPVHQLAVSPQLYDFPSTEPSNDVGISDGGQAVSDDNGGATQSDLKRTSLLNVF